jgi:hypothetical protein
MLPLNHTWQEGSMIDLIETKPRRDVATQIIEHLMEELRV